MINVAVFASGSGNNAENLVKTFNSGSRIHVALCLTDIENTPVADKMEALGVPVEYFPDEVWANEPQKILDALQAHDINMIALDGFMTELNPAIETAYRGRLAFKTIDTPLEEEVMKLAKAIDSASPGCTSAPDGVSTHKDASSQKSVDDAWADALGVKNNAQESAPASAEGQGAANEKPWMQYRRQSSVYNPQPLTGFRQLSQNAPQPAMNSVQASAGAEPMPPTWLVWSVICTVFFSTIPGIIAIIQSVRVSSRYYGGDIEGAKRSSRYAEIWIIVSFVLGVISNTLYLPLLIAGWL